MFRGPYFIVSTMQAGTTPIFTVFGMTGPSINRESNPQILLVSAGSPYHRLLQSAGATEDLFVTRELHQEPHPGPPPDRRAQRQGATFTHRKYNFLAKRVQLSGAESATFWCSKYNFLGDTGTSHPTPSRAPSCTK